MTDIDAAASTQHGAGRPLTRPPEPETDSVAPSGPATAANPEYVAWLERQSMLHSAATTARQLSGTGAMWQRSYALPDPRGAVRTASVWFTAYPASLITAPDRSFIATLADDDLWRAFASIGVQAVHTGPVKEAGGLDGWTHTESIDGYFDRISSRIDPGFGTDDEYRTLCAVATSNGGTVIDDLVPAHTGKGADFRLAELGVGEYPGAFHMVAIAPEDWGLLPEVPEGSDTVNLDVVAERALTDAGYIVGPLQRVLFRADGIKDTNWAATRAVVGVDGIERRWVYLHYFKEGQPSINWLDPTFAGPRLVIGDALQSLTDEDTERIRRAHLLLAAYNAFQPGVFALSGWDLTGMLTLPVAQVEHLMGDADTRWINRGAHDLMGVAPDATSSGSGLPRGRALHGDLPSQLVDPDSFVSRLRGIVALRARHGIAEATLLDVPDADEAGVLALVLRLPDESIAMTALNFSSEPVVEARVTTSFAVPGASVIDLGSDEVVGEVDEDQTVHLVLGAHDARVVRIG